MPEKLESPVPDPVLTQNGIGAGRGGQKQRKIRRANGGKIHQKMHRKAEEIRTFRQVKSIEISGISTIWKRYFRKGGTVVSERWQKISDFPTRLTRFKCQPYNPPVP